MSKIVIVKARGWKVAIGDEYSEIAQAYKFVLEQVIARNDTILNKPVRPSREVVIVQDAYEAEQNLDRGRGTIVFLTREMKIEAERVAEQYPHARIVILTYVLPEQKVLYFSKHWDQDSIAKMIISG